MAHDKNRPDLTVGSEFKLYQEIELWSDRGGLPAGSKGTVIDIPPGSKGECVAEFVDANGATLAIFNLKLGDVRQ